MISADVVIWTHLLMTGLIHVLSLRVKIKQLVKTEKGQMWIVVQSVLLMHKIFSIISSKKSEIIMKQGNF